MKKILFLSLLSMMLGIGCACAGKGGSCGGGPKCDKPCCAQKEGCCDKCEKGCDKCEKNKESGECPYAKEGEKKS